MITRSDLWNTLAARLLGRCAAFSLVALLVLYPDPRLLWVNLGRWASLGHLPDVHAPALEPLRHELRARLPEEFTPVEALRAAEALVYERLPYAHDWETWGVVDYVPTAEEALWAGREDCDGRAVVAAALLRGLGYDARLVTDFGHVWVVTSAGATMSPGERAILAGGTGERVGGGDLDGPTLSAGTMALLADLPRNAAMGVSVFPGWRVATLGLAAVLVCAPRSPRPGRIVLAVVTAGAGLLALRRLGASAESAPLGLVWTAWAASLGGVMLSGVPWPRRGRSGAGSAARPEPSAGVPLPGTPGAAASNPMD